MAAKKKNKRGKEKGKPAKATPGQMVWGPNGKNAVVIFHQKWTDTLEQESDFVHSFKVKGYKMKCKAPEGGGQ